MKFKLLALTLIFATSALGMDNQETSERNMGFTRTLDTIAQSKEAMSRYNNILQAIAHDESELYAAGENNSSFRTIIKSLGDINAIDPELQLSPLMFACHQRKVQIVKMLLAVGADRTVKNKSNQIALDIALGMIDLLKMQAILVDTHDEKAQFKKLFIKSHLNEYGQILSLLTTV